MENNDTKKVLVIKDVPSNMIEEAILILKDDSSNKNIDTKQERIKQICLKNEAQDVINDYIKRMGLEREKVFKEINKKKRNGLLYTICTAIICCAVVITIVITG